MLNGSRPTRSTAVTPRGGQLRTLRTAPQARDHRPQVVPQPPRALRYLIDRAVQRRQSTPFPWGTFTVNALGCLFLGLLTGAVLARAAGEHYAEFISTGLCGALTTYSTFPWETVHLARTGQAVRAGHRQRSLNGIHRIRRRDHRHHRRSRHLGVTRTNY